MKKTLSFFGALAATAFILSSCGGDDPAAPFLTVKDADGKAPASTVVFDAAAGSKTFNIESSGKWSITKSEVAPWLTVNPSSGTGNKTVSVSIEACAETAARSVVLKFMLDSEQKASFTVQQSGAEAYLNVKDAENKAAAATLAFEPAAGEATYNLESNTAWSVTGATEWLKVAPASGSNNAAVKVSAAANTSFDSRTATLKFLVGTTEKLAVAVTQSGVAPFLEITQSYGKVQPSGGEVTFTINTNLTDLQHGLGGAAWLSVKSSTAAQLVLTAAANPTLAPRDAAVQFTSASQPGLNKSLSIRQILFADMLDVEFQADGTAKDVSPAAKTVQTFSGPTLSVYNNTTYKRYAAKFENPTTMGSDTPAGFYKVDYAPDAAYQDKLRDGHSLEVLCMLSSAPNHLEIKPFSSMEQGGTGFLVNGDSRGRALTFLTNTSAAPTNTWRWASSAVVPEAGKFYHMVGVWDKTAGKSRLYIDGALVVEGDAPDNLNLPQDQVAGYGKTTGSYWFNVGGDSNNNDKNQNSWNGDVVIARVFDKVLTAGEAAELFRQAKE